MSKTLIVRLKKAGNRISTFSIKDSFGTVLIPSISKNELIEGISLTVEDNVYFLTLSSTNARKCCSKEIKIPLSTITNQELVDMEFESLNTASLWKHLTNLQLYNNFYGCIHPYVIEYPFSYQLYDEILQNIKDNTKVYTYLSAIVGVSDDNRRIETDDRYFNKALIYNNQQSTGLLELENKPVNNLKAYLAYPKYNTTSKAINFTKSDNIYQYNDFWNIVKDLRVPLFTTSCESMSIDKEINQANMDYSVRSFKKDTIRAKEVKVRHTLDNASDIHLVSQFIIAPAQISY